MTVLEKIFVDKEAPDAVFRALMPAIVELLQCDRCFLYLRDPQTRLGKAPYCYCRSFEIPDVTDTEFKKEPTTLEKEDPMFAAALHCEPSIFVEDVESDPRVNPAFEKQNFGHRALIHVHLCHNDELWGILQPCVFNEPRQWTDSDREAIAQITTKITPLAVTYVKEEIQKGA